LGKKHRHGHKNRPILRMMVRNGGGGVVVKRQHPVGVIGGGQQAAYLSRWLESGGQEVVRHDPVAGSAAELDKRCRTVYVCLDTPMSNWGGPADVGGVRAAVASMASAKTVVIRSTVPPGTCHGLQAEFPYHVVLHSPTFDTDSASYEDFCSPFAQVVGYVEPFRSIEAHAVRNALPPGRFTAVADARTTEMAKYALNSLLATKVVWANQVAALSDAVGADYEFVRTLVSADARVGDGHLVVRYDGRPGFGGSLPKDLAGILAVADSAGVDVSLLREVWVANDATRFGNRPA